MSPAVAAARRRHPSARAPVPVSTVAGEVAGALQRSGVRQPLVAAAALQLRGRSGMSPDEWARHLGMDADALRAAEAGAVAVDALPEPLRRAVRAVLLAAAPRRG